jgi:hypothetical protein
VFASALSFFFILTAVMADPGTMAAIFIYCKGLGDKRHVTERKHVKAASAEECLRPPRPLLQFESLARLRLLM